jgi:hypothetical protein
MQILGRTSGAAHAGQNDSQVVIVIALMLLSHPPTQNGNCSVNLKLVVTNAQ